MTAAELLEQAFCPPSPSEVLVRRAQAVGTLAPYIRTVEGWQQESEDARRRFACRVLFAKRLVRREVLTDD